MYRLYNTVIQHHLAHYRQMVFLSGPRQVGKTMLSQQCVAKTYEYVYLNWDDLLQRDLILSGIEAIYQQLQPDLLSAQHDLPVIIFDEIHKYPDWKNMLKGYFDVIEKRCKIVVTGSAKLNIYRRGGDSMMGRYFLYRIHPLSVAEIIGRDQFTQEIVPPRKIPSKKWQNLLVYGGFPEPYLNQDKLFYQRWYNLKQEQLFKEDLRELSKIHELSRIELLAQLLLRQVGSTTKYSELSKKIRVSEPTIRHWLEVLRNLYYCFAVTPWSTNITRSLLKEPKVYLWDWSAINELGSKIENLVACHLLKAVHFWTDIGLGEYKLYYLRDKDQREVDFLVVKNRQPWLMIEVKNGSNGRLSQSIKHFSNQLTVPHVLQVVADLPYVDEDCFSVARPMVVPLTTFLSQLV